MCGWALSFQKCRIKYAEIGTKQHAHTHFPSGHLGFWGFINNWIQHLVQIQWGISVTISRPLAKQKHPTLTNYCSLFFLNIWIERLYLLAWIIALWSSAKSYDRRQEFWFILRAASHCSFHSAVHQLSCAVIVSKDYTSCAAAGTRSIRGTGSDETGTNPSTESPPWLGDAKASYAPLSTAPSRSHLAQSILEHSIKPDQCFYSSPNSSPAWKLRRW